MIKLYFCWILFYFILIHRQQQSVQLLCRRYIKRLVRGYRDYWGCHSELDNLLTNKFKKNKTKNLVQLNKPKSSPLTKQTTKELSKKSTTIQLDSTTLFIIFNICMWQQNVICLSFRQEREKSQQTRELTIFNNIQ